MNTKAIINRLVIGLLSGFLASAILIVLLQTRAGDEAYELIATLGGIPTLIISGLVTGLAYAVSFRSLQDGLYSDLLKGLLLGILVWVLLALNVYPLILMGGSMWNADYVGDILPKLMAHLFIGALVGFIFWGFVRLAGRFLSFTVEPTSIPTVTQRIVVLGGGYAGVAAAQSMEQTLLRRTDVHISLVSQTNYLVHTPMLSEVAASSVDARHISPPLRSSFQRVQVVQGSVARVDMEKRVVHLEPDVRSPERSLPFDHLVVTSGSVPNFFGNQGVEQNSFTLKSLEDAERLRNQMIDMFERADFEEDEKKRHAMLTFVVAGGGFAGVELLGGMNDFCRGMLPFYPNLTPEDVHMILVHSRDTILPELSPELGQYAKEKLTERGVEFVLNTRVTGAEPGRVLLGDDSIETQTFVWTAGNRPSPVLETLGVPLTNRGQLDVNVELTVTNLPGVWAAGDCAQVPDRHSRTGYSPPTAQHALRQGKIVGYNVAATILNKPRKPFDFKTLGSLATLGHQVAVAEVMGYRFSGFLAWLMWRGIYLSKLPTLQKQVRVGLDWVVDLFFPPDIAQTINFDREK